MSTVIMWWYTSTVFAVTKASERVFPIQLSALNKRSLLDHDWWRCYGPRRLLISLLLQFYMYVRLHIPHTN